MNSRLIFVVVFSILLMPIASFGQTFDNIQINTRKQGEFSIQNVKVSEKEFYKVIFMDVHIKVKNLELEDGVNINQNNISLVNENGKSYFPKGDECEMPDWGLTILGKNGGIGKLPICYRVENDFNNFKVYYRYNVIGESYLIGSIDLNQINQQTVQTTEKSPIDAVRDVKIPDVTKSKDFFTQLFDMLRNLFRFF